MGMNLYWTSLSTGMRVGASPREWWRFEDEHGGGERGCKLLIWNARSYPLRGPKGYLKVHSSNFRFIGCDRVYSIIRWPSLLSSLVRSFTNNSTLLLLQRMWVRLGDLLTHTYRIHSPVFPLPLFSLLLLLPLPSSSLFPSFFFLSSFLLLSSLLYQFLLTKTQSDGCTRTREIGPDKCNQKIIIQKLSSIFDPTIIAEYALPIIFIPYPLHIQIGCYLCQKTKMFQNMNKYFKEFVDFKGFFHNN